MPAGTSLNGQSQTDGVLVDVRRHWGGIEVLDDGARGPGRARHVLGHVNRVLAPVRTPARTRSGVDRHRDRRRRHRQQLRRHALRHHRRLLPDGRLADLRAAVGDGDRHRGADAPPRTVRRRRARSSPPDSRRSATRSAPTATCASRIARKFEIKNTTGYRLCAFLDGDEPLEIFRRLLIGSEGTLAFIAEAVYETVALPARTTLTWIHFDSIAAATAPVADLVAAGATAVELMVAPALMVAANSIPGTPRALEGTAARVGRAARRVRGRRRPGSTAARRRLRTILAALDPTPFRRARVHPRSRRRSSSTGGCARACTDSSAGCARPARP